MTEVTGIAETVVGRIAPPSRRPKEAGPDHVPARRRDLDQVELSETARRAGTVGDTAVRSELVERVRREIADGTYLTDDKVDAAVERILRGFDPQS